MGELGEGVFYRLTEKKGGCIFFGLTVNLIIVILSPDDRGVPAVK